MAERGTRVEREPIFNVPRAVVLTLAVLAGIHVVRNLLSPEDDAWMVYWLAFVPARYSGLADVFPGGVVSAVTSWVTHTGVHADVTHLIFNSAWLLAFGSAIAERVGAVRYLALFVVCGFAGALTFLAFNWGLERPMIGASGAISGLMGAALRFFFSALDEGGVGAFRENPKSIPLMPLSVALQDRRLVLATLAMVFINVLAIFGLGSVSASGGIAWEAHIGGYFAGLLLFGLFDVAVRDKSHHQPTLH